MPVTDKIATIEKETSWRATMFLPTHIRISPATSPSTGLHGMHVLGGCSCSFTCGWPVSKRLYQRNPEHLANRVEVSGLFWHFVDLVWILCSRFFTCSEHEQSARYFAGSKGIREYAHGIQKHVRGYLMVGALPMTLYRNHGGSFLCRFRNAQSQYRHAMLWHLSGRRRRGFHAFGRGKTLIYRILIFTVFLCSASSGLFLLAWYDYPVYR